MLKEWHMLVFIVAIVALLVFLLIGLAVAGVSPSC
jgi:hypothetical protein